MRKEIKADMEARIDSVMSNVDNDNIRNTEMARAEVERIKAEAQEESDRLDIEKAGKATMDMYQSYISAGFTEEQAWELLTIRMKNALKGGF
jgi:regulator of protease activity HflC (stomatin/prohibitin superfamily)